MSDTPPLRRTPLTMMRRAFGVLRDRGPSEIQFWFIALLLGIAAGWAAVLFRIMVIRLQSWAYGVEDTSQIHSFAADLAWYWLLCIPILGGLVVGLILHHFTDDARVKSVAEVIEAAALNDGQVQRKQGLISSLASMITLSTGGSSGREGPVVHLAGVMSSYVAKWINADGIHGRELLGCAVAAAVSASFNAPIAGTLFALEVVLRHFAVHAFAPIAIASVAGTVVSRLTFGDTTEFSLPEQTTLAFYQELPAFMILGLVCGVVAFVLMRAIFWTDNRATELQDWSGLPRWVRPTVAGALLGLIAIGFPHIIGVGYETTSRALNGGLVLHEAIVFVILKVIAVAITIGGRMGGGIFSPALMVGALTGLAFGLVATAIFPTVSGDSTLYALAGMGGVAAAVLGAPISTTLIVFELTGDWQTGLAVMVTVSLSTALSSRMVDLSYFLTQLERRGIHIAAGPQAWLLGTFQVQTIMRATDAPRAAPMEECQEMLMAGTWLATDATLEAAMPIFDKTNAQFIPIAHFPVGDKPPEVWGALFQVDALKALNRAMASTAAEEHS